MYEIEFYEKENGESDVWDFLEELREKSEKSKDARIQYNQLMLHIQLLQNNGTRLPNNITKHIEEDSNFSAELKENMLQLYCDNLFFKFSKKIISSSHNATFIIQFTFL